MEVETEIYFCSKLKALHSLQEEAKKKEFLEVKTEVYLGLKLDIQVLLSSFVIVQDLKWYGLVLVLYLGLMGSLQLQLTR